MRRGGQPIAGQLSFSFPLGPAHGFVHGAIGAPPTLGPVREACEAAERTSRKGSPCLPDETRFDPPARPLRAVAAEALARRLTGLTGKPVNLVITNNRSSLLHARRNSHTMDLRLHHMFLDAPDLTVRALARYLVRGDRRAGAAIDAFIHSNSGMIAVPRANSPLSIEPRGRTHNLQQLFQELNGEWFDSRLAVQVTWGRRTQPRRRRRQSVRLGSYIFSDQVIRLHPVLDQPWVPEFFVRYVLFHEMLHVVTPPEARGGRTHYHGAAFRSRERRYPDYERALRWEKAHLNALLSG